MMWVLAPSIRRQYRPLRGSPEYFLRLVLMGVAGATDEDDVAACGTSALEAVAFVDAGAATSVPVVAAGKTAFPGAVKPGDVGCAAGLSWLNCVLSTAGPCSETDRHMKNRAAAITACSWLITNTPTPT